MEKSKKENSQAIILFEEEREGEGGREEGEEEGKEGEEEGEEGEEEGRRKLVGDDNH